MLIMQILAKYYYQIVIYIIIIHCIITIQCKTIDDLINNTFQFMQLNNITEQQHQQQHNVQSTTLIKDNESLITIFKPELFNENISNVIASNVLNFAINLANNLNNINTLQSEIFSPLSIISALSLLLLGAKGNSYQQLKTLIGLDNDVELQLDQTKYHRELALMLMDVQQQQQQQQLQPHEQNFRSLIKRKLTNWRQNVFNKAAIRPMCNLTQPTAADHNIKIANGMFIQTGYSLNENYKQVMMSLYDSELMQLNYVQNPREAKDYINTWVNTRTYGKIPNIIKGQIDQSTNILLASVLYFKGFWETSFFPRATKLQNFYPDGIQSTPLQVPMMATGGLFPFYEAKEYDCRIIGLPYKGNEVTMYVIQPYNSTRYKLNELQYNLNAQRINKMIEKMLMKTTIMVFPKMQFIRSLNMKHLLQYMGLHDIFIRGLSDLSLIGHNQPQHLDRFNEPALIFSNPEKYNSAQQKPLEHLSEGNDALNNLQLQRMKYNTDYYHSDLFVEDIVHKVDFNIDEQGTEAAAATLTYLHRSGTDVVFRGDTPFLILIRHDPTKLVLFYGIINKPEF